MRVFGRDTAEIVPHAGDDARDRGLRKLGKGAANVAPSMFGDAQKGPMRRASSPPTAEAQSSGKDLNPPNRAAAPQASRRSANQCAFGVMPRHVVPIAEGADSTTTAKGLADNNSSDWIIGLARAHKPYRVV